MSLLLQQLAWIRWERRPVPLTHFLSFEEANGEMALRALFPSFPFDACERGGGGGLKQEFHLMEVNPKTSNPSPPCTGGSDFSLTPHQIRGEQNKINVFLSLKLSSRFLLFLGFPSFMVEKMLDRTKAKFVRHLPDWCGYLLTWRSPYLGGQLQLIPP